MKKHSLVVLGLLLAPAMSLAANTETVDQKVQDKVGGHGEDPAAFVAEHDLDGDGKVDAAEFEKFRRARFAETDTNGDGVLSRDEYVGEFERRLKHAQGQTNARQMKQADVRFNVLDKDKDGKMTWDEYAASGERLFKRADRNGDGVVDARDNQAPDPEGAASGK
ncbi:EF-hand domain-containing protein [Stenotrophomonas sp. HITSZ_GD]|uniref:EF-hand domain-containing protein n=1 Tax=Stenotrophomonas sp. HITSZ_GD TaxID=3037248 RepID=UPI00240D07C7|nr:EF-hand domain-containing protein [Stenotrophomonas sp. HITSZ_GD]MDG2525622.1 EF-hand domain-containing protein [Stenotrophomonas sp. HITSZ_GD]